jgi:hypothetical protein
MQKYVANETDPAYAANAHVGARESQGREVIVRDDW